MAGELLKAIGGILTSVGIIIICIILLVLICGCLVLVGYSVLHATVVPMGIPIAVPPA